MLALYKSSKLHATGCFWWTASTASLSFAQVLASKSSGSLGFAAAKVSNSVTALLLGLTMHRC